MAQQLFSDIPASAKSIPGMVTPDISADRQPNVDWAAAYALQRKMKEDSANAWARAAAINNARAAQSQPQGHDLPGTASQTSGMGYQNTYTAGKGPILWAPRSMNQQQLGTWSDQQQKKAMAENRRPPIILKAYADDPIMPGEQGGGMSQAEIGKSIFGPGLTSPLGGSNPYALAKGLTSGSVGRTRKGKAPNIFPEESLDERTRASSGPQYQYDTLYRG